MNFVNKHIGLNRISINKILNNLGYVSLNEFTKNIIPENINYNLTHFEKKDEYSSINELKEIPNRKYKYLIGLEYNENILPNVIKRNLLENPKWYTSYTPYQAEISQGRMESLFNYQTLISELTGLPVSNCSLLDSGSACGEAMTMAYASQKYKKNKFFIDENIHPHLIEVLKTKCYALEIDYEINNLQSINIDTNLFGVITSYPNTYGEIEIGNKEILNIYGEINNAKIPLITHNDLMSLLLLKSPGNVGANISIGSTQGFGLPMWYGGPHSAFIACDKSFLRYMPGRIVGKTIDRNNNECYRLALQTREQHIRKEKALSNICTSQALLANTVSMFAIYHGKENLIEIAKEIELKTNTIKNILEYKYFNVVTNDSFDTIVIECNNKNLFDLLKNDGFYVRKIDNNIIGITINEAFDDQNCVDLINSLINNFDSKIIKNIDYDYFINIKTKNNWDLNLNSKIIEKERKDKNYYRDKNFLNQEIFREEKNETFMLRYINSLCDKDYSLAHGMIPLGSCTMKLNSSTQMTPLSFDSICNKHPYEFPIPPIYNKVISELSEYLLNVTNMHSISYMSNSGAMGEYSGLLCIKKYHEFNDNANANENSQKTKRNICLIPSSAHGTNFATANMCKLKVVRFEDDITINDFETLVSKYSDNLSCLMITYPNTYGVFNENIKEICGIIHKYGGLVYMDGANMNAQVGLTSPGTCGADVCHLNIHKTFCIPHGGGGPGMGPICVNEKLAPFLPTNIYINKNYDSETQRVGMITNSQYSSASLLTIPYLYFKNMGSDGVTYSTQIALLNANYLKNNLEKRYKIYSQNSKGLVGHEFIIDLNEFKYLGINDKDIAKRLIDYGFHPPTMSWPVPNSLMIEPTESESKEELDRFIEAMNSIYDEILEIKHGKYPKENNVLVNAPHSCDDIIDWKFDYSIEKACYPLESLKKNKFWPSRSRINDIYGDKNLVLKIE